MTEGVTMSTAAPTRVVVSVDATVRKNARYAIARKPFPRIITSKEYKDFVALMAEEVRRLGIPKIAKGTWRLSVWTTWPRQRHLDVEVPMGDSDASLSAVKDALQEAQLIDEDMRILGDGTYNRYEKDVRRVVAVLERDDFAGIEDKHAALLAEVATARSSTGYRQRTAEYLLAAAQPKKRAKKATKRKAKKAAPKKRAKKATVKKAPKRAPPRA